MTLLGTIGWAAAASAGAVGLAAGAWSYGANWPTSQMFGKTFVDGPETDSTQHAVMLTFDDGPSSRNTPELLDVLAAAGAVGTFFLIGNHVRRHPALARRIVAEGHVVANHTDMHPNLSRKPVARVRAELEACQRAIFDTTGVTPALFRPPYGGRRPAVLRIARELGLAPVMWNITAGDWASPGAVPLLARVDRGIGRNRRRGRTSTLLLHDASHLDGDTPHSRADTVAVVAALVQRPELRFPAVQL